MQQHSFGYWLKLKRKGLDLTQAELADQVGCSAAAIRKIEAEERRPSAQIVERLAKIFNIPEKEQSAFLGYARGDWKFAPSESHDESPWVAPGKASHSNIPSTTTSLIGREQEISSIREYLLAIHIRLVTLIGPPGIGKTRLGIEVARTLLPVFPDGVFFVALASIDDPTQIAPTIAQALGYIGATNMSTTEQLKEGIGDKHVLIVLDNCEHLIEDVASLVSLLLSACSRLKILATSRESLRIAGEWLYPVPAFDVPAESSSVNLETVSDFPALALFAERARAVRPDFALNAGNIETVSAICARLDGLPLVIELIAARMRLMSPKALLERLNDQFILSADGMRAASTRQKTLEDAIGWSYNLLSVEEQKLLASLSVFSGGFTLDAAESIFSETVMEKSIAALIALLLDKSLLQSVSDRELLFTMLVVIQQFARERLRAMGQESEVRNKHLNYFINLARQADQELRKPNQLEWLQRLESARDNLRSALTWAIETGQTEIALLLVRKLHWFWFVRGDHTEGRQWLQRVLNMTEASVYPDAQAEALTQLAHHTVIQIGGNEAQPFVEHALSIARAHDDRHNMARALAIFGLIRIFQKEFGTARAALEESIFLHQEIHDEWGYAHAMICLAQELYQRNDRDASLSLHEQTLMLFRKTGDKYFESVALRFIGILRVTLGNIPHGITALQESLTLAQQLGSTFEIAMTLWSLADALQGAQKIRPAVSLYWMTKVFLDSIGAWTEGDELIIANELAACRAALDESAFAEAEFEGRAMTIEQAISYALKE